MKWAGSWSTDFGRGDAIGSGRSEPGFSMFGGWLESACVDILEPLEELFDIGVGIGVHNL